MSASDYTKDRDLAAYALVLGADFPAFVAQLPGDAHWIDAGAGEARAQRALAAVRGARCPRLTAIGLEPPSAEDAAKIRHVVGAVEDIAPSAVEPADLITDVYGPLQYSTQPWRVVERYAQWLKPGARLWCASPAGAHVATGSGDIGLGDWLCRLPAFHVLRAPSPGSPAREIVLVRTASPPEIPRLELVLHVDGPPPLRRFRA